MKFLGAALGWIGTARHRDYWLELFKGERRVRHWPPLPDDRICECSHADTSHSEKTGECFFLDCDCPAFESSA